MSTLTERERQQRLEFVREEIARIRKELDLYKKELLWLALKKS